MVIRLSFGGHSIVIPLFNGGYANVLAFQSFKVSEFQSFKVLGFLPLNFKIFKGH